MTLPFMDLSFAPSLLLVSRVRAFVRDFYGEMIGDEDVISRLEMATHEMLENAVKGSLDDRARVRIELHEAPRRSLTVQTWNRARPKDLEEVAVRLQKIGAAPDPIEHYQALMEDTSTRLDGSGLGLGRVRAEAEMILSHTIEGDVISIMATMALPARA